MGIGKAHAFRSQAIDVGRTDGRVLIVTGQVAVTQVVGQDVDDVRHPFRNVFLWAATPAITG
jgi:hypothetical protein